MKYALAILLVCWIVPGRVDSAGTDSLYRVQEKGKWGFINRDGKFVIKPQFDDCFYNFSDGLAAVEIGRKWGYIDEIGRTVIPAKFDSAGAFKNGIASVRIGECFAGKGRSGFIDRTGNYIFDCDETLTYTQFHDGLMPVKKEDKWGYMNTKGEWAIAPRFKDAEHFSDGLAGVWIDDETTGYINTAGEWMIRLKGSRPHFEGFSEGLAPVFGHDERKFGFINRSGELVIPPRFDEARSFSEGLAAVCIVGKDKTGWPQRRWGAIDHGGKLVVPAEYKTVWSFREGMAKVVNEEGNGFVNLAGELAIPCKFACVDPFENGLAYVRVGGYDDKVSWSGYIDKRGKFVWRPLDFAAKDKARAKAMLQEKSRIPTIKLLAGKSNERGLLLTWPKKIPFRGDGAGQIPISVVNLLDKEVFIEVTGVESLSYSLEPWNGGYCGGGGGFTIFPDNANLLKRLHATHYTNGKGFTCGCCIAVINGKLGAQALAFGRARGTVTVWIRGFYRNSGKYFSESIELPIELVEPEDGQAGAAEPATQPIDEAPVKDQPPPPTSKDAPR